jgi:hypothetical protein
MKFYKITYYDNDWGSRIDWATSQANAQKIVKQLLEDGNYSIGIKPEEVPTSKEGLLDWLKHNVQSDNG